MVQSNYEKTTIDFTLYPIDSREQYHAREQSNARRYGTALSQKRM